ncbi:hypothetical protein [Ferrithrix thermotolerans]|uniref:hypothetical protein n=1 Tax=Ferrithrix thermotolerans TaxID=209649 RepID=UPI0015BE6C37|nr:hypothetical protein [Ferrithrix thermotolerans]
MKVTNDALPRSSTISSVEPLLWDSLPRLYERNALRSQEVTLYIKVTALLSHAAVTV